MKEKTEVAVATNYDSILALQAEHYDTEETFVGNGREFTCSIVSAIQTSVISQYQNNLQSREKALNIKKTLDISVPLSIVVGREDLFPGWVAGKEDCATFPLTKTEEILTATTIEMFVAKPHFTWAEAVVFGRINGSIALKIQKRVINWLQDEGLIDSKND